MRFLCLHGMGTNSQIFEAQIAPLRYRLGDQHQFEFVEGAIPWPAAQGVEETFGNQDSHYAYFDSTRPESVLEAISDLRDFIEGEGPFDGVIGFSQGGCIAATLIAAEEMGLLETTHPSFRCGVFLSSGSPIDIRQLQRDEVRQLEAGSDGEIIRIPTAHCWATNDAQCEVGNRDMALLCRAKSRAEVVHTAGHGVPSASKSHEVDAMIRAVQKTIDQALMYGG